MFEHFILSSAVVMDYVCNLRQQRVEKGFVLAQNTFLRRYQAA